MMVFIPSTVLANRGGRKWKTAYIGGTFDCLHRGHLALIWQASQLAENVTVSVNTDEFAEAYKRRPLMPLADRMAVLRELRMVDRVIINQGGADSRPSIEFAGADCIVHGSDWSGDSLMKQMGLSVEWLQAKRIDLIILHAPVTSTTEILKNQVLDPKIHTYPITIDAKAVALEIAGSLTPPLGCRVLG
jgi:cytidyltransferase-like protein